MSDSVKRDVQYCRCYSSTTSSIITKYSINSTAVSPSASQSAGQPAVDRGTVCSCPGLLGIVRFKSRIEHVCSDRGKVQMNQITAVQVFLY